MLIADAPNIRLSTMCLCELSAHHIMVVTMGRNHLPCTLTIPMVANTRQSRVTARQAAMSEAFKALLWKQVVVSKIENQARALSILGLDGAEEV